MGSGLRQRPRADAKAPSPPRVLRYARAGPAAAGDPIEGRGPEQCSTCGPLGNGRCRLAIFKVARLLHKRDSSVGAGCPAVRAAECRQSRPDCADVHDRRRVALMGRSRRRHDARQSSYTLPRSIIVHIGYRCSCRCKRVPAQAITAV